MPSSDIYETQGRTTSPHEGSMSVSQRRRRRSPQSFDETVEKDLSRTHRRRRRNTGVRRFQHLMRKPDFNRKFWTIVLSVGGLILILLLLWDRFFRYAKPEG